jgi:hypothetical protein
MRSRIRAGRTCRSSGSISLSWRGSISKRRTTMDDVFAVDKEARQRAAGLIN